RLKLTPVIPAPPPLIVGVARLKTPLETAAARFVEAAKVASKSTRHL
ncbi:MAG: hypothetical protein QOF48_1571, partial [Verrucomicrobiota bacterium]